MRTLEVIRGTTPTFLFQITDADSSGVNIDDMGICMTIYDEIVDGVFTKNTIVPLNLNGSIVDYFNREADNGNVVTQYQDDLYCRNLGNGLFAITLPYSLLITGETVPYQVFLFKMEQLSIATRDTGAAVDNEKTGVDIIPARYHFMIIPIDTGNIEFIDSYMVGLRPAGKRESAITV